MNKKNECSEIQIFTHEKFGEIRTVEIDGEIYFVGVDVAKALGYENARDALRKHVDKEDKNTVAIRDGIRGNPNKTIINESGLYSLILASKLKGAKEFKHWVTSDVLPSIRKTGSYNQNQQKIEYNENIFLTNCKIFLEINDKTLKNNDFRAIIKRVNFMEETEKHTPKTIKSNQVEKIFYPLDKLDYKLWEGIESGKYSVKVEKQGSKEEVLVHFHVQLPEKRLTAFDKRVYLAICALYEAGNEYMTAGMIYRTMGGNGRPNQKKFEKLKDSIMKLMGVVVSISNENESEKYGYPYFHEIGANLISCEYETEVKHKGGTTEYCLQLFKKPLLMRYAEEHKQLTTYTIEQFQLPVSITEMHCAIDDYFRVRIARCSGSTLKILYKSLFEYCRCEERKQQFDAKKKFATFLDFYIKIGLIKSYSLASDAIIIQL